MIRLGMKRQKDHSLSVGPMRHLNNLICRWGGKATPVNINRHDEKNLSGLDESMSPNAAPLSQPQGRGKGKRAAEAPAFRRGERHHNNIVNQPPAVGRLGSA
jgi:hypothetical protein